MPTGITLTERSPTALQADALAVPIAAGETLEGPALELNDALGGAIGEALTLREHRGRLFEVLPLPTGGRVPARRVLLYGLGVPRELDGQRLRHAHQERVRAARSYGYATLGLVRSAPLGPSHAAAVVEGCMMGAWERRARQTSARGTELQELKLAGFDGADPFQVEFAIRLGEATNQARSFQHMPPNELVPERVTGIARELAMRHQMEFEALGTDQLVTEGYRLLVAAAGTARQPQLIRIHYRGGGAPLGGRRGGGALGLVGLAHCGAAGKGGPSGASAVLAALDAIADARLPVEVVAVIPAVEDSGGPRAGTVWGSANGKTVEVAGPGAAAALAMGDALTFALRRGATHLVDLATLTEDDAGALGPVATPAVAGDAALWELVGRAAELAGERTWPLPTYAEYRGALRSRVADLRTQGPGDAGTIRGAMFLREFTERRPWVHLDVATSAWHERHDLSGLPRGPLGTGTRTLIRLAELFPSMGR